MTSLPADHDGIRPLDGIKVVDLSRILAGPYCTQYLGEMGADVVKVEPPGHGDDTRGWGPPFVGESDEAVYYLAANRNKRGIVLDLKSDRGREALRRLVADADVLVENFRPGTLEKWGLGYPVLSDLNPRLIHVSITGFGQTGPYRDRAGYDLVAQALGGVMSLTGEPDGAPAKVGLPVADLNAGTWAIIAVLMALQARHTTAAASTSMCPFWTVSWPGTCTPRERTSTTRPGRAGWARRTRASSRTRRTTSRTAG